MSATGHASNRQHEFRLAPDQPRLRRSRDDRLLTGLCGGIATFTGLAAGNVRLVFVLTAVVSLGVVALAYLALSLLIPAAPAG
ncbi:MAG TPA: PspC domain-containing protein [Trueperaceae bacterium]|nr:PspC domain-containing protein [Trueperaceae bacterium]